MLTKTKDIIFENFLDYLTNLGVSDKTLKNYKSDLNHFIAWLVLHLRSFGVMAEELKDTVPFLNSELANDYKQFMLANSAISPKTANRRLSTLRNLSRFLLVSQVLDHDFAQEITNHRDNPKQINAFGDLISEFEKYLGIEKVSQNTSKNYISDIRQFLSWLENQNQLSTK